MRSVSGLVVGTTRTDALLYKAINNRCPVGQSYLTIPWHKWARRFPDLTSAYGSGTMVALGISGRRVEGGGGGVVTEAVVERSLPERS